MPETPSFLGVGVYAVPDAARLTKVSHQRIRRWLLGYKYRVAYSWKEASSVWMPDLPRLEGRLALSFRDLIEVRFVNYFLSKGVTWKTLRSVATHAASMVDSTHPFSTQNFRTDGYSIFLDYITRDGDKADLLDVMKVQYAIRAAVEPYLYEGLHFDEDSVIRWFPMAHSERIVIDPRISFGRPAANPEGVPTAILARSFKAEESYSAVGEWYRVDEATVREAVEYERRLAAAA